MTQSETAKPQKKKIFNLLHLCEARSDSPYKARATPTSMIMDLVGRCRLLVRKFPEWLRTEDKESLLRYFGATDVAVMSHRGRMVSCT